MTRFQTVSSQMKALGHAALSATLAWLGHPKMLLPKHVDITGLVYWTEVVVGWVKGWHFFPRQGVCCVHAVDVIQLPKPKHVVPIWGILGCLVWPLALASVGYGCHCANTSDAVGSWLRQINQALSLETASGASGEVDAHQTRGPMK